MTSVRIIRLGALLMLAIFALANLAGIEKLWGMNFLKFFNKSLTIFALLSISLFFVPGISKITADAINECGHRLKENKKRQFTFFALTATVLIMIFLLFSSSATLLGDGSLRVNQVEGSRWWLATEPLDFFLHAVLFRFIFEPLGADAENCYRWVSVLSGLLFLFGAYRLAAYLNPKKWPLNLFFMATSGLLVLFFGYIESYSPAAALIPLVFLSGLKTIESSGSKTAFLILFVITGLLHLVTAMIFSLGAVLVIVLKDSFTEFQVKKVSRFLAIFIGAFIAVIYAARYSGLGHLDRYVLGIFPGPENTQGILTINHWLNVLNWIFIAALPALILAPALVKLRGRTDDKQPARMHFALWCSVPPLLFLLLFTPQLGGPRDWDLFSLPVFTVMLSVLAVFHCQKTGGLPHQILPVIVISFWIVFGFAGVNSSKVKAAERQQEIIEFHRFKNLFKDYANLFQHAEGIDQLQAMRYQYALQAWQEPPLTKTDSVYILDRLVYMALERSDSAAFFKFLNLAVNIDTTDVYGHLLLLNYYNQFESLEKVLGEARLIEKRFPDNTVALAALGVVYSQIDSTEKAETYYAKAYLLDSSRFDINLNYGTLLYQNKKPEHGLKLLRRAHQIKPDDFLVNFHLSSVHFQTGRLDSARHYYEKASPLAKQSNELQLLKQLQTLNLNLPDAIDSTGETAP